MPTTVAAYRSFISQLEGAIALPLPKVGAALLDGDAALAVEDTMQLARRRRLGAFFTPQELADRATDLLVKVPDTVFDPACGAGDLLLPIARRLPVAGSAEDTLRLWGRVLGGCDLVAEFVEATRLRLALLAALRAGGSVDVRRLPVLLPDFSVADGRGVLLRRAGGALVLNPPFGVGRAPRDHDWMHGRVARAAIFLELAVGALARDDEIVAILPDVIRSGSRYQPLRQFIARSLKGVRIDVYGRFGNSADVDVFVLSGRRRAHESSRSAAVDWGIAQTDRHARLGAAFAVAVGPIVEYRDASTGASRAFLASRHLRAWTTQRRLPAKWGAGDRVITPPFVAIARTSSPSDRHRARAAVIAGRRPVAVENHLITAAPRSGKLRDAQRLMAWLGGAHVNRFLQGRIRCRHLTVQAVSDIPWPASKKSRRARP